MIGLVRRGFLNNGLIKVLIDVLKVLLEKCGKNLGVRILICNRFWVRFCDGLW
jgi:hypothetical protein